MTHISLLSEDAKIFISSMFRRSVTFTLITLDSLQPSLALIFHGMGFKQTVKSLGQRETGWGKLLRNLIGSDVSRPYFVVATTLVFQLLLNFSTVLSNQTGNLCRIIISPHNQSWSTESCAFLTSIHAMLRLHWDMYCSIRTNWKLSFYFWINSEKVERLFPIRLVTSDFEESDRLIQFQNTIKTLWGNSVYPALFISECKKRNRVTAENKIVIFYGTNYLNIPLNWSLTVSEWRFHENGFIQLRKFDR